MLATLDVVSRHLNNHEPARRLDVPNEVPERSDMSGQVVTVYSR